MVGSSRQPFPEDAQPLRQPIVVATGNPSNLGKATSTLRMDPKSCDSLVSAPGVP